MKKLKKLIAGALAVAVSAVCMMPFASGAAGPKTFNFNKDPNGDGSLNIADATYITQCLGGRYFARDYEQLDMDDNGLVTRVDALLIQYYEAGIIKK